MNKACIIFYLLGVLTAGVLFLVWSSHVYWNIDMAFIQGQSSGSGINAKTVYQLRIDETNFMESVCHREPFSK